jgi:hypothetical protein
VGARGCVRRCVCMGVCAWACVLLWSLHANLGSQQEVFVCEGTYACVRYSQQG